MLGDSGVKKLENGLVKQALVISRRLESSKAVVGVGAGSGLSLEEQACLYKEKRSLEISENDGNGSSVEQINNTERKEVEKLAFKAPPERRSGLLCGGPDPACMAPETSSPGTRHRHCEGGHDTPRNPVLCRAI